MPVTVIQKKQVKAPGEVARRYARAFYLYLADKAVLPDALEQIRALHMTISDSTALREALADRRLDPRRAEGFALALAKRLAFNHECRSFVGFIARQGRLARLGEIVEAILLLDAGQRGEVQVEVDTAVPLDEAQRVKLHEKLKQAGFEHIVMTERLDPALIGGLSVRVGSILFDTSVAGRLTRLQNAMKGAA